MASNVVETVVGAGVIAVALGFLAYASQTTDLGRGGGSYPIEARFFKADGVAVGGDVRMSGVKVGSVREIELDPQTYEARVVMTIRDGLRVPSDSSAKIASDGACSR